MLRVIVAVAVIGVAVWHNPVGGHEIPVDVTVRALVKPEGAALTVLVRVPLESMRDVVIPTRDSVFLEMGAISEPARTAAELWIAGGIRAYENGRLLARPALSAVQISLPSDRSFESWDQAVAHVRGPPLPPETELVWTQAHLDVLLRFEVTSEASKFAIETDFARLGLRTRSVIRFMPPDGTTRVFEYVGDAGVLHLDPRWHQAARRFIESGLAHILGGTDHLLFLLCLVVPVRRFRSLVLMVTAFTVAHSITLIVAASGFVPDGLWFPPFVETLIAISIVWMALENIAGTSASSRRWALTFAFGLVHGLGFSFALRDSLQFGGTHFATSLVAFNVGVELGQLAALLVMVPVLFVLFRYVVAERIGGIIISAIVAHHAWHWMMDRGADLLAHDWPTWGPGSLVVTLRVAIVVWVCGWIYWHARKQWGTGALGQ